MLGRLELDLVGQARVVEADLRAADEQRRAGLRRLARGDEDVRATRGLIGAQGGGRRRARSSPGSSTPALLKRLVDQADHALGLGDADVGAEGELVLGRDGGLGIVAGAQVLEGLVAGLVAELGAQRVEEERVVDLVAAALAEELALDGVQRVDVGARDRRLVGCVLGVPGVHARDVGVDVGEQLQAVGPGLLQRVGLLAGDLVGERLARLVAVEAEDELDGRDAGDVDGGERAR